MRAGECARAQPALPACALRSCERPARLAVSWTQFILLTVLSLATTLAWQVIHIGWPGELSLRGLPDTLIGIPLLLLAAWLIAALARRSEETLALVIAVVAAAFWLDMLVATASAPRP